MEAYSPSNFGTNLNSLAGTGPIDLEKLRKEIYENKSTFDSRVENSAKDKYAQLRRSQHLMEGFNGTMTLSSENNRDGHEEVDCTVVIEREESQNKSALKASVLRRESQEV